MPLVVVSEFMNEAALAPLRAEHEVLFDPELVDERSALLAAVADAEAIIVRNRTQVDDELLTAAPRLRVVGRLGVGLDNIDMGACQRRGIAVHPATGANTRAVAEYVIASVMMLFRGAYQARDRMVDGAWPRGALQGRETSGKTLGLVGLGGIARLVAERATAFGMTVAAFDPFLAADDPAWTGVTRVDNLADLLARSDAISLHVPLTDSTRHLINADSLGTMRSGAIVVNTSRGGVVDDAALAAAIRNGHIAGAALDVFETEPLTATAAEMFADLDNVVLTPHIAGLTTESNERVSDVTVENVKKTLDNH
ncbi:MAG: hydroxyacid dehydrogenase [Acidimicrobiia bacterium]|nr:hydroxyacid dehydrogenase [Acidimicrobiia bacterium]